NSQIGDRRLSCRTGVLEGRRPGVSEFASGTRIMNGPWRDSRQTIREDAKHICRSFESVATRLRAEKVQRIELIADRDVYRRRRGGEYERAEKRHRDSSNGKKEKLHHALRSVAEAPASTIPRL